MPIITISRGSYSWGKEVAEKAAQKLGYKCIAREVLIEASEQFNIPEIRLLQAIHDAPSFVDQFIHGKEKEKYITYFQAVLLKQAKEDKMVYHGLAGHFFLKDISHVLKVRIIADFNDRVKLVTKRDRLSRSEAIAFLKKIDDQRRRWSLSLYDIDTWDASLYDMVLHIKKITVDDAVDFICNAVGLKQFQTTPESKKKLLDLALAAEVKAALVNLKPDVDVSAHDGIVLVRTGAQKWQESKLVSKIRGIVETIPGVKDIEVQVLSSRRVKGWS